MKLSKLTYWKIEAGVGKEQLGWCGRSEMLDSAVVLVLTAFTSVLLGSGL